MIAFRDSPRFVRMKAALTALRFYRRAPEEFPHGEFNGRIVQLLANQDVVCIDV
jgi:hypothetical protein